MRKILLTIALQLFLVVGVFAQLVSTSPASLTADAAITVTLNVAGTPLAGYTGDVYLHTGVTVVSGGLTKQWSHVIGAWGDNAVQPKMTALGGSKYQIVFSPNLNSYFNVLSAEEVTQLCVVFRSADGSLKASSSDIFIPVVANGLNIHVQSPSVNPYVVDANSVFKLAATGNTAESISLLVDDAPVAQVAGDSFTYNLTSAASGKHKMTFVAKKGSETKSSDIYYIVKPSPTIAALSAGWKMGANYIDDNTVTLVLYAPKKSFVFALGDFNNWQIDLNYSMNRTPDGNYYWITLNNLEKGKEYAYQYLIDGEVKIADPYTAKVLDPDNDKNITDAIYPNLKPYPANATGLLAVFQTAQQAFDWKASAYTKPLNKNLNIYELLIRDFTAKHNYQSLIDSLPYLKKLGINAIELMPINEFEGNESWGYNPSFYFAPDKYYGPANDLKRFVDECHKNNMAVIMDQVLNHSFGSSPMVRMYYNTTTNLVTADNPWYNVSSPNTAYSWGYDFNHESADTKRFVDSVAVYWMSQFKVDGFRFDFAKGFTNTVGDGGAYDQARINILKRMANKIWAYDPSAYVILELFADNSEEIELSNAGLMIWGNINYAYGQSGMSYSSSDLSQCSYKARNYTKPNLVSYMESHDEEREAYRIFTNGNNQTSTYQIKGDLAKMTARLELNAALFFPVPGPKMIWQFGEQAYDKSIDYNGRVGNKPLLWNEYQSVPERQRLVQIYAEWMKLRANYDVFSTENYTTSLVSDTVKSINLHSASLEVAVVGNFDCVSRYAAPKFTSIGRWYEYFSGDSLEVTDLNAKIKLRPSEYRMYTNVKLAKNTVIAPPRALSVAVSGNATVGSVLTGSYKYFDLSGDQEGASLMKWFTSSWPTGLYPSYKAASGNSYTVASEDVGKYIFFEVTPLAQTGKLLTGLPVAVGVASAVVSSISESELGKISFYPNPVVDALNISLSEEITRVVLLDCAGKQVVSKNTKADGFVRLDLSSIVKGSYFLMFYTKDGLVKTEKIIK